jgi:16S rRNA (cytosine967-C5)-methyltransferase
MGLLKIVSGQKPREIAVQVLQRRQVPVPDAVVEGKPAFVENLLESALNRANLSPADRGLCQELVYGVARWQGTLDWLIDRKTPGRPPKSPLRDILRLGLYQIFWLERIPNHAAVHETVELARHFRLSAQTGFINAVLRGYLREVDGTRQLLASLKASEPHLGYSHPEWIVKRWMDRWGPEETWRLLEWNNTPPKTYARVNLLKTEPGKLLDQWRQENVSYDFTRRDWLQENMLFELKSHPPIPTLPSFQKGGFYIQDPSTLLAVQALDPKPGERILDFCAAPGGKLTHIAQLVRNEAKLIAHDISPDRMKLVQENCSRLGVNCVQLAPLAASAADPLNASLAPLAPFDRILLDAPCSNTGVMGRRVDLRWRIQPSEIQRLATLQLELLSQAATLLRPGGALVYSTCSLEPEENDAITTRFLQINRGFSLDSQRSIGPVPDGTDGAYVAKLVRH